jgi:hypothetical protein
MSKGNARPSRPDERGKVRFATLDARMLALHSLIRSPSATHSHAAAQAQCLTNGLISHGGQRGTLGDRLRAGCRKRTQPLVDGEERGRHPFLAVLKYARGGRAMDDTAEAVLRYRKIAIDLRASAEEMRGPENRAMMLAVADRYERLADAVERVLGSRATH